MTQYLEDTAKDISAHRSEIIDKLLQFSVTDMLLFWGSEKSLIERQQKVWEPIIKWAGDALETEIRHTDTLNVPEQDKTSGHRMRAFLNSLSDKELAAFYAAALNTRSVLLAMALVRGKITAEQAFEAAFLEELWQNENWGAEEEAVKKRELMKQELKDVEAFLKA